MHQIFTKYANKYAITQTSRWQICIQMQMICNFIQKQICMSCAEKRTKKIALNMHKIFNKYALNFPIHDFNMQDMQNICKNKCTKMHKKSSEYAANMQNMHKSMCGIFCKILRNMPPHLLIYPACGQITVGTARQADGPA